MAGKLQTQESWNSFDNQRMTNAVREIAESDSLRFFFRSFLVMTGVTGSPGGADAHTLALNVGRHQIGSEIVALFMRDKPELFAALLSEDAIESTLRAKLPPKEPDHEN